MMARQSIRYALLIALLSTAGCAALQSGLARQDVLGQYSEVQQRSAKQLESELPALENAYQRYPSDYNRVYLAVVLGFGDCGKCDRRRALKLFNETAESGRDVSMVTLASIFAELLETRARVDASSAQLQKEQQRIEELQQKLNALTSIEESLRSRE